MKRILAVLLMLAILLCGMTVTASAASPWNQDADGNWTYTKADGTLATDEWIKDGGKWYYFDGTIMLQNISWKIDDVWYAFDKSGAMANNGWIQCRWTYSEGVNLEWYYANKDGSLVKGWKSTAVRKKKIIGIPTCTVGVLGKLATRSMLLQNPVR